MAMVRPALVVTAALAATACAAEPTPEYVVRLDLDQIAAATAARDRDTSPGFESLAPDPRAAEADTPRGAP
jgi:hypothetical protein